MEVMLEKKLKFTEEEIKALNISEKIFKDVCALREECDGCSFNGFRECPGAMEGTGSFITLLKNIAREEDCYL